jgi:hypothetical protein
MAPGSSYSSAMLSPDTKIIFTLPAWYSCLARSSRAARKADGVPSG